MNSAMSYGRLTWKEFRTQRSLWLSVLILTVLLQFSCVVAASLLNSDPIPNAVHAAIAFTALSVYMLGCGATLFALEHETGTFDFQRLLPVTAWHVYAAKMLVGVVSGIVLLVVLLGMSHAFYVGWRSALAPADWVAGIVTSAEVFVWAVLFSLLLRHPLRAALCGIFMASVIVCVIFPLWNSLTWQEDVLLFHRNSLGLRVVVIAVLTAINSWLAWRWFHGKIGIAQWISARRPTSADYLLLPTGSLPIYFEGQPIGWRRLVGITWRQGRWVMLLLGVLYVWAFVVTVSEEGALRANRVGIFLGAATFASAIVFGLCAFTLDQWSYQFRFYAERGVNPRWLWLSRHAVWLLPTILQTLGVLLLAWSEGAYDPREEFMLRYGIALVSIMIYALSQFFAMFLHSTILAFVVSVFSAVLSGMWTMMMLAADIPIWWSVLPIPVVLLFATWYFAADWIEERKDRRHWARVALVLGVPSLAILIGCAAYRAYQIPLVDPGFSVDEYTRPLTASEQETLRLYGEADRLQAAPQYWAAPTDPKETKEVLEARWLAAMQPALSLLEQAHERTPVPVTLVKNATGEDSPPAPPYGFLLLLRMQAEANTNEGKLSDAWRYYEIALELLRRFRLRASSSLVRFVDSEERALLASIVRWSAHPQQSKDRIAVALAKLEANENQESNEQRWAKIDHVIGSLLLRGQEVDPNDLGLQKDQVKMIRWMLTLMPWEKTRIQRLMNIQTRSILDPASSQEFLTNWPTTIGRWQKTTILVGKFSIFARRWEMLMPTWRRAARILVALVDWRREHGELPETLQQLVGPYFRELPLDPVVGRPFFYSSRGLPEDVVSKNQAEPVEVFLTMDTPFVWSPGWSLAEIISLPDGAIKVHVGGREVSLGDAIEGMMIWRVPEESPNP